MWQKLKKWFDVFMMQPEPLEPARLQPQTIHCPDCGNLVMIYDQEQDCCTSCKTRWDIV